VQREPRNAKLLAVDYLRVYVIVVVVAVHSFLAYFSFSPSAPLQPFTSKPYAWVNYPVVDAQRWGGFDLVFLFNENLVLTLMFLMSGWFVWGSITRKGRGRYLTGRLWRLGIPLLLALLFVSPPAYYPSYALREAHPNAADFVQQWLSLDFWSPGPAWFIAVLLVFDLLIVPVHRLFPRVIERLARVCSGAARSPGRFYLGLMVFIAAVYGALVVAFGARWLTHVPFEQTSRLFVFLVYFFAGIAMGVHGTERGLLAQDRELARHWKRWLAATVLTFAAYLYCLLQVESHAQPALAWLAARNTAHLLCGGATCFFMIAVFARFSRRRFAIADSVSANAFGIYLLHYPFTTWSQYALLDAPLSGAQKGLLVFAFAFLGSWALVAAIRQAMEIVRRVHGEQPVRVAG
jgi:peptidoglycan/LPS O-acetylase OafA/YrhL